MNLCDKVFRQIGNPLEWSSAKKANLLLWIYLVQQSIYQVWIEMAMRLPEFAGMIDLQQVGDPFYFRFYLTRRHLADL